MKGANILLTSDLKVKISDFGVSRSLGNVFQVNRFSFAGTIYWMAPELARQQFYSCKADIWSVGCLVLEMLTGQHPWSGLDQIQALYRLGFVSCSPLDHYLSSKDITLNSDIRISNSFDIINPCDKKIEDDERKQDNSYLSSEAKSFIEECLRRNEEDRPEAGVLLSHPFLSGYI